MDRVVVFVDTNVILAAYRAGLWPAVTHHFALETVAKCTEEVLTGNRGDARRIEVKPVELRERLAAVHSVSRLDLAKLILEDDSFNALDDGERHLLAWLRGNPDALSAGALISTADKAAIAAVARLGWLDYMISLGKLARLAGEPRSRIEALPRHYREDWLEGVKAELQLRTL